MNDVAFRQRNAQDQAVLQFVVTNIEYLNRNDRTVTHAPRYGGIQHSGHRAHRLPLRQTIFNGGADKGEGRAGGERRAPAMQQRKVQALPLTQMIQGFGYHRKLFRFCGRAAGQGIQARRGARQCPVSGCRLFLDVRAQRFIFDDRSPPREILDASDLREAMPASITRIPIRLHDPEQRAFLLGSRPLGGFQQGTQFPPARHRRHQCGRQRIRLPGRG